jgi:hypothetical protein
MVHSTLSKENKVGTSSVEAPTAQALMAQSGSKVLDDNLTDDDPDLLDFNIEKSEIVCRGADLTQGNRTIQFGILDGPVFMPPDAGSTFLVLGHEDVEGVLWVSLRLAPLVLLPSAIIQTFQLNHPRWPFFSFDDIFTLGRLSLRWPN